MFKYVEFNQNQKSCLEVEKDGGGMSIFVCVTPLCTHRSKNRNESLDESHCAETLIFRAELFHADTRETTVPTSVNMRYAFFLPMCLNKRFMKHEETVVIRLYLL